MATLDDLNAAINQLATDVSALLAASQNQQPQDFQQQVDQLSAIDQEVVAATPAAPAPAPAADNVTADAPQPNTASAQG